MSTVLIVEDDFAVIECIEEVVSMLGYDVLMAQHGQIGLAMFQTRLTSGQISLIVSDIDMPVMNGISMVKEIRKSNKNVKILMMSGGDHQAELKKLGNKINGFLAKPFSIDGLATKIIEIMK